MPELTQGAHLMNSLSDGRRSRAPSAYVKEVRKQVTIACEELIEVGARIRPLLIGEEQVGWVRGIHQSERKHLARWVHDNTALAEHTLVAGTTLSLAEIRAMSAIELRSIFRVVEEMTRSDLRLYPYLSAFITTSTSEQLWFSHGTSLSAFTKRPIELPDGKVMTVATSSDHARLWATLCSYREKTRRRIDDNMNALLIIRPWAGKGADPLANELKTAAKALIPDIIDPWEEVVSSKDTRSIDDGWAHSEDDSREGIKRELAGMVGFDRHEQVMAAYEEQQKARAQAELDKISAMRDAHRQDRDYAEEYTFYPSPEEVRARDRLRFGRPAQIDPALFGKK